MAFMLVGLLLLGLKFAEVEPVHGWHWGWVLLPFLLAALWWAFSDAIGLTQKRSMDKMEAKKESRRQRNLEALGLGPRRDRKARRAARIDER